MHHNRTNIPTLVPPRLVGLAAASGRGSDTVPVCDVDREDDAVGWSLDVARRAARTCTRLRAGPAGSNENIQARWLQYFEL